MPFRIEAEAEIEAEAKRQPVRHGWNCDTDNTVSPTHVQVTVTSDAGFRKVFMVPKARGLTNEQILDEFAHDTITEVQRRRKAKEAERKALRRG